MVRDVLVSPALGTASSDLIRPCPHPGPEAAEPPSSPNGPPIAVALSGGGFRATLAALGVLRFLADAGLLERVRYASSVSGGSVANAVFAVGWPRVRDAGYTGDAFDAYVLRPVLDRISRHSLKFKLLLGAWRLPGSTTRTQLLAGAFDDWWLGGRRLSDLPADVRWIINAADLTTGVRFGFERDVYGDYVIGRLMTGDRAPRLAEAVAASASVPGAFAPFVVDGEPFPCQDGRTVKLLDGGVYDNMGLQALENLHDAFLVVLNAGGQLVTGAYGRVPIVRDLQRANSLLYRESTAVRRQLMVERFKVWEAARAAGHDPPEWGRQGVLFSLATAMPAVAPAWTAPELAPWLPAGTPIEQWREELALVPTSFDRFDRDRCRALVYRGWWLAGANLSTYHPDMLSEPFPVWREP